MRFKNTARNEKASPVFFRLGTQLKSSKSIHLSVQTGFKKRVKHVGLQNLRETNWLTLDHLQVSSIFCSFLLALLKLRTSMLAVTKPKIFQHKLQHQKNQLSFHAPSILAYWQTTISDQPQKEGKKIKKRNTEHNREF